MGNDENTPLPSTDVASAEAISKARITDSVVASVKKRIIVCCDGTWQDGIVLKERYKYTNILKLSRAINHEDNRTTPTIPQIVYYQAGIGSENNFYSEWIEGATGASLGEKVQEAYAFIATNFQPGDEIFLFGFSRGAYTARMIGGIIGEIGLLNRVDMDNFASIFVAMQKQGKVTSRRKHCDPGDKNEIKKLDAELAPLNAVLAPWTAPDSPGRKRADYDKDGFTVKVIGVFDTVGSVGLPEELTIGRPRTKEIFGFPDLLLGTHVQYAYHAMAVNETRKDFTVAKFQQTPEGLAKGQILKQCWFTGEHSDIGGGWQDHDLSDLTLTWMVANIAKVLSINPDYLESLPVPVAPWGEQRPHKSGIGIFKFAEKGHRDMPTATDDITHETVHPSVLKQTAILKDLKEKIDKNPSLIWDMLPLEEEQKRLWPYIPGKNPVHNEGGITADSKEDESPMMEALHGVLQAGEKLVKDVLHKGTHNTLMKAPGGAPEYERNWLGRTAAETSYGQMLMAAIHET